MAFKTGILYPRKAVPVKAYIHNFGFDTVYKNNIGLAEEYLRKSLPSVALGKGMRIMFALGVLWGDSNGDKIAEFFGYSRTKEWPGNPAVIPWQIVNGKMKQGPETECADTVIVRGLEEQYRRTTKNLREYAKHLPDLGDLLIKTV
jgi:hypothetical protein